MGDFTWFAIRLVGALSSRSFCRQEFGFGAAETEMTRKLRRFIEQCRNPLLQSNDSE